MVFIRPIVEKHIDMSTALCTPILGMFWSHSPTSRISPHSFIHPSTLTHPNLRVTTHQQMIHLSQLSHPKFCIDISCLLTQLFVCTKALSPISAHQWGTTMDNLSHHLHKVSIDKKDAFILFYMEGSAISFNSCVPSNHELETLPQVVITSKKPWDPKSNPLRIAQVRLNAVLLKPKIQHETERILRSVSNILDEHELC